MSPKDTEVLPLPELPKSQQGTSTAAAGNYKASVSNATGYLCHIALECRLDVSPEIVFEIFSHPDNAGAFRDIKKVGYRKVIEAAPGFKRVEVEQVGELRVMWVWRSFKTYLDVTEDARDPECLRTEFLLLRSDILSRFHGAWELRPVRDAAGIVVACDAVLTQDVLPRGVPSFFARLPVLGGLLRQVSLGTIKRLVEDLLLIVKKYKAGAGKLTVGDVLIQIASERGHRTILEENRPERLSESEGEDAAAGGGSKSRSSSSRAQHGADGSNSNGSSSAKASNVTSFAVDDFSDSEEGLSSEGGQHSVRSSIASEGGSQSASPAAAAVPPAAVGAADSSSKQQQQQHKEAALAATAAAAAAGVAAASGGVAAMPDQQSGERHRHKKRHHHHQQQQQEQEQHEAVGVMLDVSQHGHVSVVLVPGDL